ncbi:MAG: hypothetical protein ACI89E_001673 [Planctomycetota bacterium]|jgi:hypothetical protein
MNFSSLGNCLAVLVLCQFAVGCIGAGATSDSHSIMPSSDLAGWVGGTTFNPGSLAGMREAQRAAKIAGWTESVADHWRVDGDELVSDGHGPHLVTARDYGDFELQLEWKLQPKGDSGIYLRGYPQVQLWDPSNEAEWNNGSDKGSGALWNNQKHARFPLECADHPTGEWNHLRIRIVGEWASVWLNEKLVVDHVVLENYFDRGKPIASRGPVHLQTHGSETRFRKIYLREL